VSRLLTTVSVVVWVVGAILVTHDRLADWRTDETLWRSAVRTDPSLLRPRVNLAMVLMQRGAYDDALEHWAVAERLQREAVPQPPDLARVIALQRAAIAMMRNRSDPAALLWMQAIGCERRGEFSWACPAN
jgi:cytochrome c-type biogenesis protein CcmH/NrfG